MSTEIVINTFGQLSVQQNGHVIENFVSTKAVLLLVYLAMHPSDHTRKKLASMFWSETSDKQALKNLRTVLSSVRQCVPDAVIISHDVLSINPDIPIHVDANQFERGCKVAFSSPKVLDLLTHMQDLANIYQGTFLVDVSYRKAAALDEWIANKQREFQQLYSRLLHEIVKLASKQADYETGLHYATLLVNFEPLWDTAQRHLMQLLAYTDRSNDALVQYEEFVRYLKAELQAEPDEKTTALYKQIQSHNISPAQKSSTPAIVLSDIPFVEPASHVEIVQRMLNTPNCHLLTIFGMSGVGKTALATQLAFHRQHLYRDGTCFVSLSTAQTATELLHLIASALDINFSQSMTQPELTATLTKHLQTCELLLVLDNYEHLLPETDFIQHILQEVNSVQMIVTSQEPLNLYREWLVPLRGLHVPEINTADSHTYEAIRLFELTAQRANPYFNLMDSLNDIIRTCQLVDGLPLGIIMAAGWVKYISPAAILSRMQEDLRQIDSVHHDAPFRHQSFQGLLNSMLSHLSPEDQQSLMCLSVFDGSFDYKAALAVANITMEEFKHLTDKCLVQRAEGYRFTVHSIVRQMFKSQLDNSPLFTTVATRYVAYFQQWCDTLYAQNLPLHELMHIIDIEQHNLWDVSGLTQTDRQRFLMHIAPTLNEYWVNRGYHARGVIELLRAGGDNPEISTQTKVRGLITVARLLERTSQYDQSWAVCEQVLELETALNLPHIRARALRVLSEICAVQAKFKQATDYLQAIIEMEPQTSIATMPQISHLISLAYEDFGEILLSQGDYEAARYYIQIAIRRWKERGETLRESIARSYLGIIALKEQDYDYAFNLFTDILELAHQAKNQTLIVVYSSHLGTATMHRGDYMMACDLYQNALQIALQIDRKTSIIKLTEQFAQLALYVECYDIGAQLLGFTECMRDRLNLPVMPHHQSEYSERKQALQQHLGLLYEQHHQVGCNMGLPTIMQLTDFLIDKVSESLGFTYCFSK